MSDTKVICPSCGGIRVVKFGRSRGGVRYQRYECRNAGCTLGSFQLDYTYNGCRKRLTETVGATARVLTARAFTL